MDCQKILSETLSSHFSLFFKKISQCVIFHVALWYNTIKTPQQERQNMRKILLSAVLSAAAAMQVCAAELRDNDWFDAKISEYGNILQSGWPVDGSPVTVPGEGSWTNTEFAALSAELESTRTNLVVSSPEGYGPFFKAARQPLGAQPVNVSGSNEKCGKRVGRAKPFTGKKVT